MLQRYLVHQFRQNQELPQKKKKKINVELVIECQGTGLSQTQTHTHTHTHTLTQHTGVLAATYVGPTKPGDGKLDDRITHLHLVSLLQITRAQYHYLNSFKVVLKLHPSCLHCIVNYHCLSIILTVFWIKEERDKP